MCDAEPKPANGGLPRARTRTASPGDAGSRWKRIAIISLAAGVPAAVTILCTWSVSPIGPACYRLLVRHYLSESTFDLCHLCLLMGAVLTFVGYLLDVHCWKEELHTQKYVYFSVAGLCFGIGIIFYTSVHPSIPLALGAMSSVVAVAVVNHLYFRRVPSQTWSFEVSVVFGCLSVLCALMWLAWLAKAFSGFGRDFAAWNVTMRASFQVRGLRLTTGMLMWSSPIILSAMYFVVAMMAGMRGHIHSFPEYRRMRSTMVFSSMDCRALTEEDEEEVEFVDGELRTAVVVVAVSLFLFWVAALLLVNEALLAQTIVLLAIVLFCGILVYIFAMIGRKSIKKAAETNDTVRAIADFLGSDWCKGALMLLVWPLLPLYFSIEMLHQAVRKQMFRAGYLPENVVEPHPYELLTAEAALYYHKLVHVWDKGSVLTKSMYWGILLFIIKVVFTNGTSLLLSWVSDRLAPWELWQITLALFLLGLCLFCLPPVPGMPIYIISALLITNRCVEDGYGFWSGVLYATAFSLAVKLAAIAVEQKCIGEMCADSIAVKKIVGVHTPPMKAVRHILKKPGLPPDKVAVLVGGPDWPTSVLTGILRLPLFQMLLGSLPVLALIVPVVLATAFQAASKADEENGSQWEALAKIMMVLMMVIQLGALLAAGYYMQAVVEEHKELIEAGDWEKDPQEEEILKSIAEDELRDQEIQRKTAWHLVPVGIKVALLVGSLMSSAMIYILHIPSFNAFKPFEATEHISNLPGGNPMSLVNFWGWVAIALSLVVTLIVLVYNVWCSHMAGTPDLAPSESAPLLPSSDST